MTIISQIAQAGNTNTTATATTTTETKGNAQMTTSQNPIAQASNTTATTTETKGNNQMTTSQKQANEAKNAIDQIMYEYRKQCCDYRGGYENCNDDGIEHEAKTEKCYDDVFGLDVVKARILAMQSNSMTKELRKAVSNLLKNSKTHYLELADKIEIVFSSRLQKSIVVPFDITEQDLDAELEKVKHLQFVDVLYRGMIERYFHGKSNMPFICIATDIHSALCEILDFDAIYSFDPELPSSRILWFANIK